MNPQALLGAFRRMGRLVIKPEDEWNLVAAEKPGLSEAIFPFSIICLVICLVFSVIGMALRTGDRSYLFEILAEILVNGGTVAGFALVAGVIARKFDAVRPATAEVAAVYSCVGIWMTSCLGFIPVPALGWLWYLMGVVYTGYLWSRAMDVVVGLAGESRTRALIVTGVALLVIAGVLRGIRFALFSGMGLY